MPTRPICIQTHPYLISGPCPWCMEPVVAGRVQPGPCPEGGHSTTWDVGAMLSTVSAPDGAGADIVLSNILLHGPGGLEALPVLRAAIKKPPGILRTAAICALAARGKRLRAVDAQALEREAEKDPSDVAARIMLLGYYAPRGVASDEHKRPARHPHVLWLIEHAPEMAGVGVDTDLNPSLEPEAYSKGKTLWMRHVEAEGTATEVLGNAALFCHHHDKALGERILREAQRREPWNPQWPQQLASLYERDTDEEDAEAKAENVQKCFSELEKAYGQQEDDLARWRILPRLAKAALRAGHVDRARSYATVLLEGAKRPGFFYARDGRAVFYGNIVLGTLALDDGDVARANAHLIEAGKTKGSPMLESGGADMGLAKALLERGETEAVLQFLKLCGNFWPLRDHRLEEWIDSIQRGEVPNW